MIAKVSKLPRQKSNQLCLPRRKNDDSKVPWIKLTKLSASARTSCTILGKSLKSLLRKRKCWKLWSPKAWYDYLSVCVDMPFLPLQVAEKAIANLESIRVLPEHSQPQSKAKINFVIVGEWWICHLCHEFFSVCIKATVLNNPMTPSLLVLSATWANDSPMKAMPVWNWTNPWPQKIGARLHHEFQNLFHRLMHWVPKVLEALQQVPTLCENDCFQDANTTLLWEALQRKIFRTKKMQQHGAMPPKLLQRYTFRSKLWPLQFCPVAPGGDKVNHFFSYVLSHGLLGPYLM